MIDINLMINGETISNAKLFAYSLGFILPWLYGCWKIADWVTIKCVQPFLEKITRKIIEK